MAVLGTEEQTALIVCRCREHLVISREIPDLRSGENVEAGHAAAMPYKQEAVGGRGRRRRSRFQPRLPDQFRVIARPWIDADPGPLEIPSKGGPVVADFRFATAQKEHNGYTRMKKQIIQM